MTIWRGGMRRGWWRWFVRDRVGSAGEGEEVEDGGEIGVAVVFEDGQDCFEGGGVIGDI